jgi:hypothetical protein
MTTTMTPKTALVAYALSLLAACGSMPRTRTAAVCRCPSAATPTAATTVPPIVAPAASASVGPPSASAPAPAVAPATCASASPAAPTAPKAEVHTITIAPGWQGGKTDRPAIDAVEGEAPGPDDVAPAGTVLVAEARADREPPETITEYDLDSGREVREVSLPIPGPELRMVRAGDMVHVFAWSDGGELHYAALSLPEHRVVRVERLATNDPLGPTAVATDGRLTVAATRGTFPTIGDAFALVAFDQQGRRIGTRRIDICKPSRAGESCPSELQNNVVVVGGRPYVLLETDDLAITGRHYRLLRLRSDLSPDREWDFDAPDVVSSSIPMTLVAWGNHIALDTSAHASRALDIIFDLSPREVTRQPRCTDPPPTPAPSGDEVRELWVDHVHVTLHGLDSDGKAYLTWVQQAASGPPAPCWATRLEWGAP